VNQPRSIRTALMLLLVPLVAAAQGASPTASGSCRNEPVDIGGRRVWVDAEGTGNVTVVFEAGGGNDSSVWTQIALRIRAAGVRTFVYDRAGLGRSEPGPTPYSIHDEVHALRSALTTCGINGPVILTAHSYGGFISLLTASMDKRVAGLVLVDAVVPKSTPKSEVEAILATYRPQYGEIRKQAPELAKAMIPLMEAYPATVKTLDAARIPTRLPIIDIVAENTTTHTPETATIWRKAHAEFVARNRFRKSVFAAGSSHKVMEDKPDIVVDAILQMIGWVSR
jgi:pimeloyl-ACP methyl ester carboxylesterase